MALLASQSWKRKYTPEDGDLVRLFYVPALEDAVHYDRLTGYFSASALALAARGIEGLVRNEGRMRLLVGCTLNLAEIEAIEKGEKMRVLVERHLAAAPLAPPDDFTRNALELLAWMVAKGILEVKVAVPCDSDRRPIPADGIFHEKAGIIEDRLGDKLAWNGSLNETAKGWKHNWESINVFTSWGQEPQRVHDEEENFARLWADRSKRVITLDVPAAVRQDLLRFLPDDDRPARLKDPPKTTQTIPTTHPPEPPPIEPIHDLRRLVWGFIRIAPTLPNGGARVGEATAAVDPWPHQIRAFHRLYDHWPPKLLIADEVGLGKTIQAGLLLRQAWLAGRAKRILILAPKAVLRQWQIELREKFNLNWPIYDGQNLNWYPSPALRGQSTKPTGRDAWHKEPIVIASSHLMRRRDRLPELLDHAEPWDLIVLDEAHHARRKAAGAATEGGPNALLKLMRGLKEKTQGLVLLTATPMQVHPVEVWDLLDLLGMPPEWSARRFLQYFEDLEHPNPAVEAFEALATAFQAVERFFTPMGEDEAKRITGLSRLKTSRILRALRDAASIPRRQLENQERQAALRLLRVYTPVRHLISRHTRELLRKYYKAGLLTTPIADRHVEDRFIDMSLPERELYEAVEDYIATTYNQASNQERSAVGFVMTIYRRRLASSFRALGNTLRAHLDSLEAGFRQDRSLLLEEDTPDDETADDALDTDEAANLERQALAVEEKGDIESLLQRIERLPPDTKAEWLKQVLTELRADGYGQIMVFTQYTDTMDFLREAIATVAGIRAMCFSGRGGEVPSADGTWIKVTRDEAKRRFKEGMADVLLCTDAAAEGLNFQFCGALVNYDMPWNPMRVEQRIGRIDRLGQQYGVIRIINLHYEGTVETDVYRALRDRIDLFQSVVGRLQPILSQLPSRIASTVLADRAHQSDERSRVVGEIEAALHSGGQAGFDIDAATESELIQPVRADARLSLNDLERLLNSEKAMPPGISVQPLSSHDFRYSAPGMAESLRVTTDRRFFEEHAECVELWSPGSPLFPKPDCVVEKKDLPTDSTFERLLALPKNLEVEDWEARLAGLGKA
jgi:SNF2 family DNA or RNA helicase